MTYTPFHIVGDTRDSRWLVTCDHAANTVPPQINGGSLGLSDTDMSRHIAWDPGAAGVSLALAEALDAPVILSNFSRLVIDPNRGEDDPTLLMRLYDGTIIPGNRHAGWEERERRLDLCYRPYHAALGELVARRPDTVLVSIHSFTPQLNGRPPRPWQVGILHSHLDGRLARPVLDLLKHQDDICTGENEPYGGHLPGDSVDRHALQNGLLNVLIEVRQDVIRTEAEQRYWAHRLAPVLQQALAQIGS